ncbi:MAG: tRNA (adenosine(37)-N6)-threonylcarbamoyltransferase complex ATPase subunit type 1 TsaE [Flavobacteriaceae bacterium]
MKILFSLKEIDEVAKKILDQNPEKVILFEAEMGTGKTTLIKELCKALHVEDTISSPTFSLVNEYETTNGKAVYHFDFYRLKSEEEALDFGVEDYLYSGSYCFLEWAEKIPNLIPDKHTVVKIKILENGKRELEMK